MFGFSKTFAVVIFIAVIISLGLRDYVVGLNIVGIFAIAKIFWNILTKK